MLLQLPLEDVWITSRDGLKLHGVIVPGTDPNKLVICHHGYTSHGMSDFGSISKYFLNAGYSMLLLDLRAHGKSEGKYIGFGCLDRWDSLDWIEFARKRLGDDCSILLYGVSMGGATVLMTTGQELPSCVKAVVSDCAFTSAFEVFSSVLRSMYHIPAFPVMQIADRMAKSRAGYGLDQCNAAREVEKAKVPILFIHGTADTFVPYRMLHELYSRCASPKELLEVEGAGHAECFYKETERYEAALDSFLSKWIGGNEQ